MPYPAGGFYGRDLGFAPAVPADVTVTATLYPGSDPAKAKTAKLKFAFPSDLPDGNYEILAEAHAGGGTSVTEASSGLAIGAAKVDLSAVFADGQVIAVDGAGAQEAVTVTILNGGNVPADGTVDVKLYASTDDSGDVDNAQLLATVPAKKLKLKASHAGKRITIYKFRTMLEATESGDREAAMTSDDDDRITRVGRILRRLRIDELPQIFNILKWQMSWIGPRPEAEVLSVWYTSEIPFYRYRHVVRPGISGWAQVNQGHVAEVDEVHRKLQYDFYYIKYFSPWLDLLILLRTIKTMLTGWGAR